MCLNPTARQCIEPGYCDRVFEIQEETFFKDGLYKLKVD